MFLNFALSYFLLKSVDRKMDGFGMIPRKFIAVLLSDSAILIFLQITVFLMLNLILFV